jgi:rifampicin phosphotransferase
MKRVAGLFFAFLALLMSQPPSPAFAAPDVRARIASEREFRDMARTVNAGRFARFPQLMFIIDRDKGGSKTYFVNSKRYPFHIDYIQKAYLSVQSIDTLYEASYFAPNRRFILGSIIYYPKLARYGVEFWEGDQLDRPILEQTLRTLSPLFPKPIHFKPNSQPQIDLAASIAGLETIETNAVYGSVDSLVLNAGTAVGTLRMIPKITGSTVIRRGDIVVLGESPINLSPVAGIITTEFSTPLSHVNLLAKSWRVPNGYHRNAAAQYASLVGKIVHMDAKGDRISLRLATAKDIARAAKSNAVQPIRLAPSDLSFRNLPSLTEQRESDVIRTGAKAANLGEVARWQTLLDRSGGRDQVVDFEVPAGFSIPFAYYADFIRETGLDKRIDALLADRATLDDPVRKRAALADLRAAFGAAQFDPVLLARVSVRRAEVIGAGGVFARSSTNSEDLKGFNGAGLYSSVPNIMTEPALANAIKTVWGSIWNEAAFDARVAAGIDHKSVMASVLIQRAINAEAAGVMITENPFDPDDTGAIFINAKRGLGIRVVEGRRVAEQLLYRPDPESIQVLTRSTDDAMLVFDENGGVREMPVEPGRLVLSDDLARKLARLGTAIDSLFDGRAQDIEWVMVAGKLYIVQSRPYERGN